MQRKNQVMPVWDDYVRDITTRYGDLYDDPMAALKALKQSGSVQEYHDAFASRIDLSEPYLLSFYLAGLEDDIQFFVRMFTPTTLQQALCLEKLQEAATKAKKPKPIPKQPPLMPTLPSPKKPNQIIPYRAYTSKLP